MKRSAVIPVLAVLLAVAVSFLVGGLVGHRIAKESPQRPDTVTITKWLPQPVEEPKDSTPVKTKLVYLKVPYPVHDTVPFAVHDTTNAVDSVLVEVPIVEKTYPGDNYLAVVRGYNPELVSLWINEKQTIIKVPVRKRWSFTVGPQAGFGITPKGYQPYAGFGGTFGYTFGYGGNHNRSNDAVYE